MKNCGYCGRENSDDASRCGECGTVLEKAIPPVTQGTLDSGKEAGICFRSLVALLFGAIVVAIALVTAWQNMRDAIGYRAKQWMTQMELKGLASDIERYRIQSNALPRSIADVPRSEGSERFEENGVELDGWKRPFVFKVEGTNWFVMSYGRDGVPGGHGLDCDLTSRNPEPTDALPTLRQFFVELPTGGVVMSCLLAGFFAGLTSFFTVKAPDLSREGFLRLSLKLGGTAIGAVFIATIIASLHVPSGH